jgi:alkanesulfonate monooxygenase SsuD/methylene tetrahydromethanopterin reductase-like flavin-dependent oxidoreductase (luciferase family)
MGTLGLLFPGRVVLGIGTGESLNEVPPMGIVWPDFKERFARLREAVTLMRRLWSEERVTYTGTYYKTVNATVYDRPPGGVPLLIAAGGPQMAKYAGRVGDGFICTSGKGEELYRDQLLPAFEEGARESGHDPSKLERMIEIKVSFDTDRQRALEDTRLWRWKTPSRWSVSLTRCRPSAPRRGGSCPPTRRNTSSGFASTPIWVSTIWFSTHRGTTSGGFWTCTPTK